MQYMDADPKKRPTAQRIWWECCNWWELLGIRPEELNEREVEIRNAFLAADKIISTLSIVSQRHSNAIYISQFIDTQKIFKSFKSSSGSLIINDTAIGKLL